MVDIIIGSVQPVGPPAEKPTQPSGTFEAEILNIRTPRKAISGPEGKERRKKFRQDPLNGQVLTILIPNGTALPKDLDSNKYKVMVRFMKK
jgi:hypothetical protein